MCSDSSGHAACTWDGGFWGLESMAGLVDSGGGGSYSGFDLGGGSSGQSRLEEVVQREIDFFTNTSEQAVLDAEYLSFYHGIPVIKIKGDRSAFWGAIFLTPNASADTLRHEYGHSMQMHRLGLVKYSLCIMLPSWQEWGTCESYYDRPWEVVADIEGNVMGRSHLQSTIQEGYEYLLYSELFGIFAWLMIK